MAVNRPYTPRDWETGDVITEEFLDNIEEGISAIDSEIYEARGLNPSSTTLKQRIDDLVIIQNTKPTSDNNKIWIKGTSNSVRVPSYNEAAATYATNLWIDTETNLLYLLNRNGEPISDGVAVPTGGGEGGGGGITINSQLSTTSINPVQNKVITAALNLKQDILTFDSMPTAGSSNPVTSGGVAAALVGKQDTLTFDNVPTANSDNPVNSGGVKSALDAKQDALTFDSSPASGSSNPVTSGGVFAALTGKEAISNKVTTITSASTDTQYPSAAAVWALFNSISNADATSY